jgi:hypothetical protein
MKNYCKTFFSSTKHTHMQNLHPTQVRARLAFMHYLFERDPKCNHKSYVWCNFPVFACTL